MTLTELTALSPDEIRVRVAELMGWQFRTDDDSWAEWQSGNCQPVQVMFGKFLDKDGDDIIPRYTSSLDSCHEFEDAMNFSKRQRYVANLQKVMSVTLTPPNLVFPSVCIFATPLQKCQAYILTMEATKTEGAE